MGHLKNAGGWFIATMLFASLMMVGLGLSKVYALTLTLMFISGWDSGFFMNLNLTLIQANTPRAVMGRVMSIYGVRFMGGMPIGAFLAGVGAQFIGAPAYFATCGVMMAVVTIAAFLSQPSVRRMSTLPVAADESLFESGGQLRAAGPHAIARCPSAAPARWSRDESGADSGTRFPLMPAGRNSAQPAPGRTSIHAGPTCGGGQAVSPAESRRLEADGALRGAHAAHWCRRLMARHPACDRLVGGTF